MFSNGTFATVSQRDCRRRKTPAFTSGGQPCNVTKLRLSGSADKPQSGIDLTLWGFHPDINRLHLQLCIYNLASRSSCVVQRKHLSALHRSIMAASEVARLRLDYSTSLHSLPFHRWIRIRWAARCSHLGIKLSRRKCHLDETTVFRYITHAPKKDGAISQQSSGDWCHSLCY